MGSNPQDQCSTDMSLSLRVISLVAQLPYPNNSNSSYNY